MPIIRNKEILNGLKWKIKPLKARKSRIKEAWAQFFRQSCGSAVRCPFHALRSFKRTNLQKWYWEYVKTLTKGRMGTVLPRFPRFPRLIKCLDWFFPCPPLLEVLIEPWVILM